MLSVPVYVCAPCLLFAPIHVGMCGCVLCCVCVCVCVCERPRLFFLFASLCQPRLVCVSFAAAGCVGVPLTNHAHVCVCVNT